MSRTRLSVTYLHDVSRFLPANEYCECNARVFGSRNSEATNLARLANHGGKVERGRHVHPW